MAAVRGKGRGDLEGGGSNSEEMEGKSGRRRLQQWTWRTGSGGRRGTWRLERSSIGRKRHLERSRVSPR